MDPRATETRRIRSAGIVFTSTFDGEIYALDMRDGTTRWQVSAGAGINSCPARAGDTLLVGAGVPQTGSFGGLIAYRSHECSRSPRKAAHPRGYGCE
jgi:outer membrane protein assembly factor BamB